jgi:hypothetical protein
MILRGGSFDVENSHEWQLDVGSRRVVMCPWGHNLIQLGGPGNDGTVGSGGGYGGFYCFAPTP